VKPKQLEFCQVIANFAKIVCDPQSGLKTRSLMRESQARHRAALRRGM
jgi:hypothetical protein